MDDQEKPLLQQLERRVALLEKFALIEHEAHGLTPVQLRTLYAEAKQQEQSRSSWKLAEIAKWCDLFRALSEDDLTQLVDEAQPPWQVLLKLGKRLITYVRKAGGFETSLTLQMLHAELASSRHHLREMAVLYESIQGRGRVVPRLESLHEDIVQRLVNRGTRRCPTSGRYKKSCPSG